MKPPATQYAKSGQYSIAYQTIGEGSIDIVKVSGFASNVEMIWEDPEDAELVQRLARFARVIVFDKRGTGLSDRTVGLPALEERMDDVRAVMDAVGSERAVLYGISEGGPMSLLFAATYPERTRALVLVGSFARFVRAPDYAFAASRDDVEGMAALVEQHWGTGMVLGSFGESLDEERVDFLGRVERNCATPGAASDLIRMILDIDVRALLPTISVPTLVMHTASDPLIPVEHGRYLADHIQGARYAELAGSGHSGAAYINEWCEQIEHFLTGTHTARHAERVLATLLFTDIVDSTSTAVTLGDAAWRSLLDSHDAIVRTQLQRHSGREVTHTGDGFFAVFDGPARAVRCARSVIEAVKSLGLHVRAGVHCGECERRGDNLSGVAVHIGARVAAKADRDEVLVSRTVVDLVAGSGLVFADRGEHDLKGVPARWQLFKLTAV